MKKFSLMELLVVMGIILLMMSLLLPAVGPMMNRAELNRVVSTIIGQIEIGHIKSLEMNNVTRVSFEYDPVGKNIIWGDIPKITGGVAPTNLNLDQIERQNLLFDINGDGIPGGNANSQVFWIKVYYCKEGTKGSKCTTVGANLNKPSETVAQIRAMDSDDCIGPAWMRRPISRVQNSADKLLDTRITMKPVKDEAGTIWYARPVMNGDLDYLDVEMLMPINDALGKDTCDLINEDGLLESNGSGNARVDRNLTVAAQLAMPDTDPTMKVYKNSVSLYKGKNGDRFQFFGLSLVNSRIAAALAGVPSKVITPADIGKNSQWFDILEGDFVDTDNINFGLNDDEDKMIDEGMSVAVESYNQSGTAPTVELNFPPIIPPFPLILHNNYFCNLEDPNLKIGREYFIGGKDRKGVMLRRIWGVPRGSNDKVLIWSYNQILVKPFLNDTGGKFDRLEKSLPYYFSIVFDVKNGSGVYACNSFGAVQVMALYFQVCDDDDKLSSIIEFKDGSAKEGNIKEMNFPITKAGQDAIGYFQGVR